VSLGAAQVENLVPLQRTIEAVVSVLADNARGAGLYRRALHVLCQRCLYFGHNIAQLNSAPLRHHAPGAARAVLRPSGHQLIRGCAHFPFTPFLPAPLAP
jgi:hypothetical protein